MEEYAYILDYLPQGNPSNHGKREPVCFALGDNEFKLFELVPRAGAPITIGDRVFIGKDSNTDKRDQIDHVKRRVSFEELNNNAASEMEYAIVDIVMANQDRFIRFFNEVGPISMKKHGLEELPGLGGKLRDAILAAKKNGLFKDFADLSERAGVKNPEKLIAARISLEIRDPERKRYLFVTK